MLLKILLNTVLGLGCPYNLLPKLGHLGDWNNNNDVKQQGWAGIVLGQLGCMFSLALLLTIHGRMDGRRDRWMDGWLKYSYHFTHGGQLQYGNFDFKIQASSWPQEITWSHRGEHWFPEIIKNRRKSRKKSYFLIINCHQLVNGALLLVQRSLREDGPA